MSKGRFDFGALEISDPEQISKPSRPMRRAPHAALAGASSNVIDGSHLIGRKASYATETREQDKFAELNSMPVSTGGEENEDA